MTQSTAHVSTTGRPKTMPPNLIAAAQHFQRGHSLQHDCNDLAAAAAAYRNALALEPRHVWAHVKLSQCLLAQGELGEGFWEFRWIFALPGNNGTEPGLSRWNGHPERTVLLSAGNAFGECLFFSRFVRDFRERFACRVLLRCAKELVPLMAAQRLFDDVVGPDGTQPAADCHFELLRLPVVLEVGKSLLLPPAPWLEAPLPCSDVEIPPRSGGRLRVGLVWAGRPTGTPHLDARSVPLAILRPLLDEPGVEWISLQRDTEDLPELPATVANLGPSLTDFSATAALLSRLDLLVTVDTAIANLAGALSVPLWVLAKHDADWRWGQHDRSPFFPTARVFRQRHPGDWVSVLADVRTALMALA